MSEMPPTETESKPRHEFTVPAKEIRLPQDMGKWIRSRAYYDYANFLILLNEAVRNKNLQAKCHVSPFTSNMLKLLRTLDYLIVAFPPEPPTQTQRFGSKSFQRWYNQFYELANDLLRLTLPACKLDAIPELAPYLLDSFGNCKRIDYGTGHEMHFVIFLMGLFKIGAFKALDCVAVVNHVFFRYLLLCRKLQTTYRMEPAGSHGVWKLDDFQFVPFVWGSSQLIGQERLRPDTYPDPAIAARYSEQYMFHNCVDHIHKVKSGPFHEHSHLLWDMSEVPTWIKLNAGLFRMYQNEDLKTFVMVQHALFGTLFSTDPAQAHETDPITKHYPQQKSGGSNRMITDVHPSLLAKGQTQDVPELALPNGTKEPHNREPPERIQRLKPAPSGLPPRKVVPFPTVVLQDCDNPECLCACLATDEQPPPPDAFYDVEITVDEELCPSQGESDNPGAEQTQQN